MPATDTDTSSSASVVRSVRFLSTEWALITAKSEELKVPIAKFVKNAVLVACGSTETESSRLRRQADALDGIESRPAVKPAVTKKPATGRKR